MTVGIYSNMPAPHQVPLAREMASILGDDSLRFVYTEPLSDERRALGWPDYKYEFLLPEYERPMEARSFLESCDVLLAGVRDVGLFEKRIYEGKLTIYGSERWFREWWGFARLMHPRYFRMAKRMTRLLENDKFFYFAYGIHAAKDMVRLARIMTGNLDGLVRCPYLSFESCPCGRIRNAVGKDETDAFWRQMRIWGYSVESSKNTISHGAHLGTSVLWVGRMIRVKRVDTVIKAVAGVPGVKLDLVGDGPERKHLEELARKLGASVSFHPPVSVNKVREVMRDHEVYVFSSDVGEGWGAVVNEALEEGMIVLGTYEAGAPITMLPPEALFHAGDVEGLKKKLKRLPQGKGIGDWALQKMAHAFIDFAREYANEK